MVLALLSIAFLVVGGVLGGRPGRAMPVAGALLAVIVARLAAGTGAAFFAALLVALGAWLRVRLTEATAGLAVFGVAVAMLGGASISLVLAFWLLGGALLLTRRAAHVIRAHVSRSFLTAERTPGRSLS
jgi:hypothetical protein